MDHIEQVITLLHLGLVMTSLDIQSAFSHLYVNEYHQKYLFLHGTPEL